MLIPNKFNGFFAGRRTYFDGGGDGGGGGVGDAEGPSPSFAGDPDAASAVADATAASLGGTGESGMGGSYDPYSYASSGAAPTAPQYSLNNYVPQNMERQFYQPIYRPQYTNYGGGISGLSQQPQQEMQPQQPNMQPNMQDYFSGVSAMPFRGQQFASYGLPFSGYDWPTYSNGGGISSLVR